MLYDLTRTVTRWFKADHDIRRLRWLDDRLLADVGIKRDDIAQLVRGRRR